VQAQVSFVVPAISVIDDGTKLIFELVVTDDGGLVDRQSVTITILDNGITAFADDVTAIVSSSTIKRVCFILIPQYQCIWFLV